MISSYMYMFDKVINISIPMLFKKKKIKTNNLNLKICYNIIYYDVYVLGASVYYNLLLLSFINMIPR